MSHFVRSSHENIEFEELSDVWDTCKAKLLVMIIEAKGLPQNCLPFAKSTIGDTTYRTKPLKNTNIVWNELFFYHDIQMDANLTVELFLPNLQKKREEITIGSIVLENISSIPHDRPVDKWYPLQLRVPSKDIDPQLHIRLLFSCVMETRASHMKIENIFGYEEHMSSFKTGDLIAFSGVGLLPSLSMIYANAPISQVGLLLKIPNKWTKKTELYVAEITRNVDRIVDSFREISGMGLNIFRFEERLYQFNGSSIFWCPLKKAIEEEFEQKMLQWIWSIHGGGVHLIPHIDNGYIKQWVIENFGEKITKSGSQFVDLLSHSFITECLRFANAMPSAKMPTCAMDVVRYDCFNRPAPLRLSGSAGQAFLQQQKMKMSGLSMSSSDLSNPRRSTEIVNNNNSNATNNSPTNTNPPSQLPDPVIDQQGSISPSSQPNPPLIINNENQGRSTQDTVVLPNNNNSGGFQSPAPIYRSATISTISSAGRKGTRSLLIPDFTSAKLERFEKLGSGGFGSVYRCSIDGYTCAMKVLKIDQNTKKMDIAAVKTEVSILERARHPNIVRYLGYDFNPSELILFMEFIPASLQKVLTTKIENPYCLHQNDSKEVRHFAFEIAKGIAYLHNSDPPIIHRDIKSGNVLVATDGEGKITTVKLCDFGVAKICQSKISAANTYVGTPGLMAPEIRLGNNLYSEKVDIWSFGILLYEMIAFSSPSPPEIYVPPELDPSFEPLIGLVRACLVENPSQRPTAKQVVECLALMYTM